MTNIRTLTDNEAAADAIIAVVRELTHDPNSAVHASIAGERKSMGFFLGYALSLFGRPQDRLSHVLVSAPFESHPEFFYPPPKPRVLFTRDNRPVRTDEADITLADIPFVRLRDGLPESLLGGRASFRRFLGKIIPFSPKEGADVGMVFLLPRPLGGERSEGAGWG